MEKEKMLNDLPDFQEKIYDKVISPIITINKSDIHDLYNNQRGHFDKPESAQPCNINLLKSPFDEYKDSTVLGIDLPLWIDWNDEKKQKLMIVGRDPQRNINNVKKIEERLIIGSPYSLVSKGGRDAKNNYWSFIEPLIGKHRLYITDIYKLFIVNTNTEKVKELRALKEHYEIFINEINFISPDKIITIGKDAADAVKKFISANEKLSIKKIYEDLVYAVTDNETKRVITVYFIPHISGQVTSGVVTIANLFKSIGMLRDDIELLSVGEEIIRLKDKLLYKKGEAENL